MKVHKKWIILMAGMTVIAFAGLFATEPSFVCDFNKINGADVAWLITATIFVLMMTPGLSFFYGGMVGAKNVISTMLQSFIAMGLVSVLWVVFGFSLAFGDDIGGVLGDPTTFLMFQHVGADTYITPTGKLLGGATIPLALYALFQMKFAIITPSLITGSFAERVRFSAYLFFMMWFMVFIYCPLAHMTWHPDGLFLKWGVVDFAGGPRLIGSGSPRGSHLPGQKGCPDAPVAACQHPLCTVGSSHAVAGMVRLQCRQFAACRRPGSQSVSQYQYRLGYSDDDLDVL